LREKFRLYESTKNRLFGYFAGFVDVDLLKPDHDNVLVEREDCILGLSCV
jgi:hypothetical protein